MTGRSPCGARTRRPSSPRSRRRRGSRRSRSAPIPSTAGSWRSRRDDRVGRRHRRWRGACGRRDGDPARRARRRGAAPRPRALPAPEDLRRVPEPGGAARSRPPGRVEDGGWLATPLAGMRITAPDGTVVIGTYRTVGDWRPYREHAMAIERARLDEALVERVRALPIDFREHVRVTDVLVERGEVRGVVAVDRDGRPARLRARLVIAADGRASVVAERLGLRHGHRLKRMALVTYVSGLDGCRDYGEVFVDPPDYAIINPVAADRGNLSIVVPLAHAAPWSGRLETFFTARAKHLQHLARRLAGARIVAPVGAMGPLAYEVDAPRVGGVLLVGDAAGFVDPFTGEGIYAALRGAELAVETAVGALRSGDC